MEIRPLSGANYLGIWRLEEPESHFMDQLWLNEEEHAFLGSIKAEGRRVQWLATRLLIRLIIQPKGVILMEWDHMGKPIIINYDFEVAITHCQGMVGVIVGDRPAGLDLEPRHDRILKVANKFVHMDEWAFIQDLHRADQCLLIWAAKEAAFKRLGGGGIDFKEHLRVLPFDPIADTRLKLRYLKGGESLTMPMQFEWIEDYALVYSY